MASKNIQDEFPDRLFIRKSDKKNYKDLLEDRESLFKGKGNKRVFLMAMITGFRDGSRIQLDKKFGFVRTEYLNSEEISIIKAVAVAEKGDLDAVLNKKEVFSIAEEYAASGIRLLKDRVFSGEYGSYAKKLEESLVTAFGKISEKLDIPHTNE